MNIADLVLHPDALSQLDSFLATPAHAVLLTGPAGTGKAQLATRLARELLATHALENQPYYRHVSPEKGTITIEQIRGLIQFFRLSVPGKANVKRVAVLTDVDAMGQEAQNALLKLLEEPPAGSVLILTSSKPQSLLPTIRSRVQTITLPVPLKPDLISHFTRQGYDEAVVRRLLLRHGDNLAELIAALQTPVDASEDEDIALVRQILGSTPYERLLVVDGLSKQKDRATTVTATLAQVATVSLAAAAQKGNSVTRWYDILVATQTAADALERNANAKLVLTELMLAL